MSIPPRLTVLGLSGVSVLMSLSFGPIPRSFKETNLCQSHDEKHFTAIQNKISSTDEVMTVLLATEPGIFDEKSGHLQSRLRQENLDTFHKKSGHFQGLWQQNWTFL